MQFNHAIMDSDVVDYAAAMSRDCEFDSSCVFIADKTTSETELHYLGNYGVSDEVLYRYGKRGICDVDPFTDTILNERACQDSERRFYAANDPLIQKCAERLADYWQFVAHEDVEVIGAATMRLQPRLYLVIGAHRQLSRNHRSPVSLERLEHRMDNLHSRIAAKLLTSLLAGGRGYQSFMGLVTANDDEADDPAAALSARETEIARLVCKGKQNKQIAYIANLSECTVENHLRRIYKKLGIHNRAALVANMHGTLH